jgi:hypothetical protein
LVHAEGAKIKSKARREDAPCGLCVNYLISLFDQPRKIVKFPEESNMENMKYEGGMVRGLEKVGGQRLAVGGQKRMSV